MGLLPCSQFMKSKRCNYHVYNRTPSFPFLQYLLTSLPPYLRTSLLNPLPLLSKPPSPFSIKSTYPRRDSTLRCTEDPSGLLHQTLNLIVQKSAQVL